MGEGNGGGGRSRPSLASQSSKSLPKLAIFRARSRALACRHASCALELLRDEIGQAA